MASDTLEIHKVYNVDTESWIYELDGMFFDIVSDFGLRPAFSIEYYHRNNKHSYIVP